MAERSASGPLRHPKPVYRGHNGFVDHVASAGPSSKINMHAVASNLASASKEEVREFRDAVQRRQFVEDMIELRGTYFPGLDAIKQANEAVETSTTLKERIQEIQQKHTEEVRTLYQWHAQDYHAEMLDMSRSKRDVDDKYIEEFYQYALVHSDTVASFDDALDRHYYAHLSTVQPLIKQRIALRKQEEAEQMRRDQQFPSSIAEFHAIRSRDVQLRIARFLTQDDGARERTMDEFGWTYRQVMPLVTDHEINEAFKDEARTLLREVEAHDPRRVRQNVATTDTG